MRRYFSFMMAIMAVASFGFIGCEAPEESEPTVSPSSEETSEVQLAHHGGDGPCNPNDYHVEGFDPLTYDPTPGPSRWANVPGADVEAGETNTQTRQQAKKGAEHFGKGRAYELYHDLVKGMPVNPDANYELTSYPPFVFTPVQAYNGDTNHDPSTGLGTAFAQIGTQVDALYHFGFNPPGNSDPNNLVYHGGFTGADVHGTNGAHHLGVEKLKPITTRAIMIDVKRFMNNNEMLPPGYEVTLGHLICSLKAQGMSQNTIKEGDVVLFNTGWEEMWSQPRDVYYQGGPGLAGSTPGINLEAAVWLASKKVVAVGSDAWAIDFAVWPPFSNFPHPPSPIPPGVPFPVHHHLIVKNGITHIESMHLGHLADDMYEDFEETGDKQEWMSFIHVPRAPMVGASGSTSTPIAYR
jgi:kynurenine formamidase